MKQKESKPIGITATISIYAKTDLHACVARITHDTAHAQILGGTMDESTVVSHNGTPESNPVLEFRRWLEDEGISPDICEILEGKRGKFPIILWFWL